MLDKSRNLVHLRWLLKLVDFRRAGELSWRLTVLATFVRGDVSSDETRKNQDWWNHTPSHVGLPTEFEDILLLLDQQLEADFEWEPYEDPTIRVVIPDDFFVNSNAWHVKVPLVVYATVEKHKANRVLRQFRFQQSIPVAPQEFIDLHRWTVGHPSAMWYTPKPSHFLMTVVPTVMYRSSMHEALMESPLAITSTYGTQHS
ncbi:hypothetical protein Gotur_008490 [Gossypium turneri]